MTGWTPSYLETHGNKLFFSPDIPGTLQGCPGPHRAFWGSTPKSCKKKTNKHKQLGQGGVWDKQEPCLGQTGPLPGTNWDLSLGQTGSFLFNSTVVPSAKCFCVFCLLVFFSAPIIRVVKTVLLANGHFAGVTDATFVSFVDFQGPRSKIPCFFLVGRMQYQNFRQFSSKPPVFGRGQNDHFPKRQFRHP